MMYVPEVEEIIHRKSERGEFFTVKWSDKTTTTVKLCEGEQSDEYTAYLYALGKKLFSNKGKARAYVKEKKKVFEDRVAKKSEENRRHREQQAAQQALGAVFEDIADEVYYTGFVAPCMVSKSVFKKNK